jgi:prophage regulatory protein
LPFDAIGRREEKPMDPNETTLIEIEDVQTMIRLSKPTIYREIRRGVFPKPLRLARNRIAWKQVEILNWLAERAAAREVSHV